MRVQLVATVLAGMALGATAFLQTPGTCVYVVVAASLRGWGGASTHMHFFPLGPPGWGWTVTLRRLSNNYD